MSIYRWSEDVILVDLPGRLEKDNELQAVIRTLRHGGPCDVVVDFSRVQMVGGAWLARLLKIQRLVQAYGHKLILCGVDPSIRGIFTIVRLDEQFEFAEDRFTALTSPQLVG
jgi:anti-anti-sigma regulatory factor